jgi:hypothetical protein
MVSKIESSGSEVAVATEAEVAERVQLTTVKVSKAVIEIRYLFLKDRENIFSRCLGILAYRRISVKQLSTLDSFPDPSRVVSNQKAPAGVPARGS